MLLSTFILIILAKKRNYFNLLHLIMYLFSVCVSVGVHACHSTHVDVGGYLVELVISFQHVGPGS